MLAHPRLALAALLLALLLPGLWALPVTDRDEARFAQASRQIVESGDPIHLRFQETPRYRKPPLAYWLQAASVAVLSEPGRPSMWPYRLPSALAAAAAAALALMIGTRLFGRAAGLAGAAILAASVLAVGEAHLATTDALLLALTTGAMALLARARESVREGAVPGAGVAAGFWAIVGAGVLVKGPVTPLVALSAVGALAAVERDGRLWRALRPAWGAPLAAVVVAPWFLAVLASGQGAALSADVSRDLIGKLFAGQEGHGAPPGAHLALLPLGLWPGSLLLLPALAAAWRDRRDPAVRFCLAWLLPAWLVFELVPTKLPHYVLPLYPALALLVGRVAAGPAAAAGPAGAARAAGGAATRWIGFALWAAVAAGLGAAAVALPLALEHRVAPAGVAAAVAALATMAVCALLLARRRPGRALVAGIAGSAVLYAAVFQWLLPSLPALWPSTSAAALVERAGAPTTAVAVAGYREPSLVFLLGTATRFATPEEAAAALADPGGLALVEAREEAPFRRALSARGLSTQELGSVEGWNVNEGRRVRLTLHGPDRPATPRAADPSARRTIEGAPEAMARWAAAGPSWCRS